MGKRQLTDEEKELCQHQISMRLGQLDYNEYILKHADLMLSTGLEQNFKREIRKFEQTKKDVISEISFLSREIEVLQDQIDNGVDEIQEAVPQEEE